jgi:hypothetical protein
VGRGAFGSDGFRSGTSSLATIVFNSDSFGDHVAFSREIIDVRTRSWRLVNDGVLRLGSGNEASRLPEGSVTLLGELAARRRLRGPASVALRSLHARRSRPGTHGLVTNARQTEWMPLPAGLRMPSAASSDGQIGGHDRDSTPGLIVQGDVFTLRQVARPEGFEHALPTFVVEGVEDLVSVLRAVA